MVPRDNRWGKGYFQAMSGKSPLENEGIENPWLEAIELQNLVYPYHDWSEKITAKCYAPNAKSRILDDQD